MDRKRSLYFLMGAVCAMASVACGVVTWLQARQSQPAEAQALVADADVKGLGTLKQQEEGAAVFHLSNRAPEALEIVEVMISCRCTKSQLAKSKLEPGETTELALHVAVGELRGKVATQVNLLYRIGAAPRLHRLPLTMTAMVTPHYEVTPEELVFAYDGDKKTSVGKISIKITHNMLPQLRILEVLSTHPAIKVQEVDSGAAMNNITVAFDPAQCLDTSLRAEVVVRTDSGMEPIHRVPVRVVSANTR